MPSSKKSPRTLANERSVAVKKTAPRDVYVSKTDVPPTRGQIAAAKLIRKRDHEGEGRVTITPKIHYLASYEG